MLRILYVEDEPWIRTFMTKMFPSCLKADHPQIQITATKNGEEFLREYRESIKRREPFDLCVVDINLGKGITDLEALAVIRQEGDNIPVIITTGSGDLEYMLPTYSTTLPKPFRSEELLEASRTALAMRT